MKLEKQVCSLELAKELKELGVKQESLFYWDYESLASNWFLHYRDYHFSDDERVSAFTVAELGEMLPEKIKHNKEPYYLWCSKYDGWEVSYPHGSHDFDIKDLIFLNADTEADARAKMLIYLIEKKMVVIK